MSQEYDIINFMKTKQEKLLTVANNAALRDKFLAATQASDWTYLTKTSTVDPAQFSHLFVVGAAFWSRPDLSALHALAGKLTDKNVTVFVFDIDEFGHTDGIKAFLPGAALPNQTPVIAEYVNGKMTRFAERVIAVKQHFLQTG